MFTYLIATFLCPETRWHYCTSWWSLVSFSAFFVGTARFYYNVHVQIIINVSLCIDVLLHALWIELKFLINCVVRNNLWHACPDGSPVYHLVSTSKQHLLIHFFSSQLKICMAHSLLGNTLLIHFSCLSKGCHFCTTWFCGYMFLTRLFLLAFYPPACFQSRHMKHYLRSCMKSSRITNDLPNQNFLVLHLQSNIMLEM